MKVKKQGVLFTYFLAELLLLNLAFFTVSFFKYGEAIRPGYLMLIALFNASWMAIVFVNGPQELYLRYKIQKRIKDHVLNCFLLLGIVSPLLLLFGEDEYSRTMIFGTTMLFSGMSFLFFLLTSNYFSLARRNRSTSRVLILGAEEKGKQVFNFTQKNRHLGYEVVGFLDDKVASNGINVLGKLQDLPRVLETSSVDEIVITMPSNREKEIQYAIETADYNGIRVNVIPDVAHATFGINQTASLVDGMSVIEMHQVPLDKSHNYFLKRMFDIVFAGTVLLLLSPILLTIAVLIKLNSKGPIFYKPVRKGLGGKEFTCFKFRTMYTDMCEDPKNGSKSTTKNDPRVTAVGKVLRKKDLDELPQFINVLLGDMSVVGPRPHRVNLNSELQHDVDHYMFRHYVKPGITGWAQVNGWRGPTITEEQKTERVRHDLLYVENWNFFFDLRIIFMTVFGKKTRINAF